ncbi:Protein of unknown function DUF247, plant [Dillenia turbinata]|uniref:Uncharacterized protein n=1 Tax=Dillenia turbinata TaxID=194707 RepID=A0AAN8UHQ9_9MAGN
MATALEDAQQSGISEHTEISITEVRAVSLEIRELLWKSQTVAPTEGRHYINRISASVRDLNAASYTPKLVAIGPYHRKEFPKAGEDIRSHYLQLVLRRNVPANMESIIEEMRYFREQARGCYDARSIEGILDYEFLKMMFFDSCFIVELIRRFHSTEETHEFTLDDDPISIDEATLSTIRLDLVLFENQLPFFVLQLYYDKTISPQNGPATESGTPFHQMALRFVGYTIRGPYCDTARYVGCPPQHLLALLYNSLAPEDIFWRSRFGHWDEVMGHSRLFTCSHSRLLTRSGCLRILLMVLLFPCIIFLIFRTVPFSIHRLYSPSGNQFKLISCSMSLHEKGVKFRKRVRGASLLDVEFEDHGTLTIPTLTIDSNTKAVFLNLLAYERYCQPAIKCLRDYLALMDCLIDSSEDVKILCNHGIFENSSLTKDEIKKLFDRPKDDFIIIDPMNFIYRRTFENINSYCNQPWTDLVVTWNKWMTQLRAKYFDSPWTLISLLAATFLLALTVVQTIFTLLSYHH